MRESYAPDSTCASPTNGHTCCSCKREQDPQGPVRGALFRIKAARDPLLILLSPSLLADPEGKIEWPTAGGVFRTRSIAYAVSGHTLASPTRVRRVSRGWVWSQLSLAAARHSSCAAPRSRIWTPCPRCASGCPEKKGRSRRFQPSTPSDSPRDAIALQVVRKSHAQSFPRVLLPCVVCRSPSRCRQ